MFSVNKADYVNPLNVTLPYVVKPEEAFSATLSFTNLGTNQVNAITIKSQIGDEPEVLYDINFPDVLPGRESQINIEGLKATSVAENAPVSMEIVKVNGADNAMPVKVVTGTVHVMSEYYNRPVVIEEGTGTTCGFCPRGYLGMEYMREKYNSSEFIGIAAHIYSDKDPMWCGSYKSAESIFIAPGAYLANYPCATVNRTTVFDPSPDDCQLQYDAQEKIAFRKVDFTARYTNPHYEELEVMCEITSATDLESHNLGLSVVTVEDGVGPYQQQNNFAGGRYGEMGGFEKKPTLVELTYNDVARTIVNWNGNAQVMPETLTAGVPAKAESLYITTDRIKDLKNSFIVVLLIDKKNGRIVNAHRIAMPDAVIENVDPASAKVVLADNADAEFYTLDGLRVTDEYLAPGLYIKRQNGKSEKILVK